MNIITSYSIKKDEASAVMEIAVVLNKIKPKAVLYFSSSSYDPALMAQEMDRAFEGVTVFGCTTSGEIVSGMMLDDSVTAIAFSGDVIEDISVQVLEDVKEDPKRSVEDAFKAFEDYYGVPMSDMDMTKYVGIILVDGLSGTEERLMERIGDLTEVPFIGGSAGDDLKFIKTHVFAGERALSNAAVLVLIKAGVPFDFLKTQSFTPLEKVLIATKVNEFQREVLEFDNQPAVQAYASALGTTVEKAPGFFMSNPVGLMIGDEPFVRSPQQIKGGSMVFYCNVLEGMELTVLQSGDIIEETRAALAEKEKEFGEISGIINFNCILRTLEMKQKGQTDAYGKIFSDVPTVGFSTYGEEFLGHINQTSTMLIFK